MDREGDGVTTLRSWRSFLGECMDSPSQRPALGLLTTVLAAGLLVSRIMQVLESLGVWFQMSWSVTRWFGLPSLSKAVLQPTMGTRRMDIVCSCWRGSSGQKGGARKVSMAFPSTNPEGCRAETQLTFVTGAGSLQQRVGGLRRARRGPS